ncbi:MAG TPA: nucleotidyl transferase AbiEii/AbiGii toxin family protein [Polyangia bacterium]|nr:nucleotidyl transferase AbiEii/AbiGii toxin family protein [Polyangia bacterium]
MDLLTIRRIIITAVASDDLLVDLLVLKGGNALEIVHGIGGRSSLDLDYSMEGDFEDPAAIGARLLKALRDRFDVIGVDVFDYRFVPRPSTGTPGQKWGGYSAEFKLILQTEARRLHHDIEAMRRESHLIGDATQKRVFTIEISKFEYCVGKVAATVDAFDCFVYSPAMIAAEKLRAICQQLPSYRLRRNPAPRPRDFYDIHSVVISAEVDLSANIGLLIEMFKAKDVALSMMSEVPSQREFHRQAWSAVENAVRVPLKPFDFYFDFVLGEIDRLQAVRNP